MSAEPEQYEPEETEVFTPVDYACEACGVGAPWKLHRLTWADSFEDCWTCDCGRVNIMAVGDVEDDYTPAWIRDL